MAKELYFDISSEDSGGSLYRLGEGGFTYNHSTYDSDRDEVKVFETKFADFAAFWQDLIKDREWYYRHPLFVHPEQRDFVREKLSKVDWSVHPDKKWQESHQRQWKKVLSDPGTYYASQA
ncbi:MAG: hypothetical protein JST68_07070 [Bacteroidetes bacterium]|nr:hypothetical protein [Bacteroidota bacterium]